uniref:Uncharacterized protein n=1 Tax=Myoviridae sp. ctgXa1 TaxID=2827700 RepID=A0A8S5T7Q6_9CAUD|nr:MAG TPA: hypothetical protein [Myoviridae sp. ctgXa1]
MLYRGKSRNNRCPLLTLKAGHNLLRNHARQLFFFGRNVRQSLGSAAVYFCVSVLQQMYKPRFLLVVDSHANSGIAFIEYRNVPARTIMSAFCAFLVPSVWACDFQITCANFGTFQARGFHVVGNFLLVLFQGLRYNSP